MEKWTILGTKAQNFSDGSQNYCGKEIKAIILLAKNGVVPRIGTTA